MGVRENFAAGPVIGIVTPLLNSTGWSMSLSCTCGSLAASGNVFTGLQAGLPLEGFLAPALLGVV